MKERVDALDRARSARFHVCLNVAGVQYSAIDDDDDLAASLEAFDELLDATAPIDCAIALPGGRGRACQYSQGCSRRAC